MNDYKFGNFLCGLREAKGMTQLEIANMLGVTTAAVSKWENGESKPRTETLFKLAEILDISAEELMAGKTREKKETPEFSFNVSISEEDYFDFNDFWLMKSPYGKKQMRFTRIIIALIISAGISAIFFISGINRETFIRGGFFIVLLVIGEALLPRFNRSFMRSHIKNLNKKGKAPYTAASVTEFYGDFFTDTTFEEKRVQKYTSVERISITENGTVYIHINSLLNYLLPVSCFDSEEQYKSFLSFIKAKCHTVDVY